MDTNEIIAAIDAEIQRLQEARTLLDGGPSTTSGTKKPGRRKLSAETRAKIVAAQKARWAKVKKAAK
jgi:hypothetical protein